TLVCEVRSTSQDPSCSVACQELSATSSSGPLRNRIVVRVPQSDYHLSVPTVTEALRVQTRFPRGCPVDRFSHLFAGPSREGHLRRKSVGKERLCQRTLRGTRG